MENDILRHSGQDRWPQSKQRIRKTGHSDRLVIRGSGHCHLHAASEPFRQTFTRLVLVRLQDQFLFKPAREGAH